MPITMPLVVVVSFFSVIHCSSSLSPLPSDLGYLRISCVIMAVCLDSFVLDLYVICYQVGLGKLLLHDIIYVRGGTNRCQQLAISFASFFFIPSSICYPQNV